MRAPLSSITRIFFVMLAAGVYSRPAKAWGATWREVQSPHFRVVTDGSEQDGRAVAKEFERMRHVFAVRFKTLTLDMGAPLLIVAVRETGLHSLGPAFWKDRERIAGQFFGGWERQFALVRLDSFGDLNQAVVFHEYTHSVLHENLHWLPTWLDEGLAEFYAYTRFQGDRIYVGAPSIRLAHVQQELPIPVAEMLVANGGTYAKDSRRQDLFYGESWAAVHYMMFGKEMEGGAKLTHFLQLLDSGTSQAAAFQQVFGDPKAFDRNLAAYLHTFAFMAGVLPPLEGLDAKTFPTRVLKPGEVEYELGSFAIGAHDRVTGRTHLEAAVAADDGLAGAHEELGFLQWDQGRDREAKDEWQKALALDQDQHRSAFALLMTGVPLRTQSPAELRATKATLERLAAKAPKFAPVFVELALVDWRLRLMQDAYKSARAAEQLAPWRAGYHLLVGHILLAGGQPAIAADYADQVASRWPGSDHDEAVDLWNQVPLSARAKGPELALAVPPAAMLVRGTIVSTSCEKKDVGRQFSVTIQPASAGTTPLKLLTDGGFESGFSDTLWFGRDHYTPCFHVSGLPAMVAYKADGADGGKLVAFEVRDDLPEPIAFPSHPASTTSARVPSAAQ